MARSCWTSSRSSGRGRCSALPRRPVPARSRRPYKDHQGGFVGSSDAIGSTSQVSAADCTVAGGWYSPQGSRSRGTATWSRSAAGVELERLSPMRARPASRSAATGSRPARAGSTRTTRVWSCCGTGRSSCSAVRQPGWVSSRTAARRVRTDWERMAPLVEWLADHVGRPRTARRPSPDRDPGGRGLASRGGRAEWEADRRLIVGNALGVGRRPWRTHLLRRDRRTSGLTVLQALALSVLMFTGGSQFALVGVLAGGGGAVSAVATAVLLGARNAFYGLRLAPVLRARGLRRFPAAQLDDRRVDGDVLRPGRAAVRGPVGPAGVLVDRAERVRALEPRDPGGLAVRRRRSATRGRSGSTPRSGRLPRPGLAAAAGSPVLGCRDRRVGRRPRLTPVLRPGVPVLVSSVVAVVAGVMTVRRAAEART